MKPIFKWLSIVAVLPLIAACGGDKKPTQSVSETSKEEESSLSSKEEVSSSEAKSSSKEAKSSSKEEKSSSSEAKSSTPTASSSSSSSLPDPRPYTPPSEDSDIARAYNYSPKITDQMARIDINTASGTGWATNYDHNYKLNNVIDYVDATVSVSNCEEAHVLTDITTSVKVRGNYTLDYPQKAIRLKFNKKQNVLGLNNNEKFKSWVLLADYKDLANSNNALALYLANNMLKADGYYVSDFRYTNLYINNQYWGVYLVAEQQQAGTKRINVAEAEEIETDVYYEGADIGYICELDYYYTEENPDLGGDPTFTINYEGGSLLNYDGDQVSGFIKGYTMKSDTYSDTQRNFIKNYLQNAYKLMYQATYNNTFYKFNADYTALVQAAPNEFAGAKECIAAAVDLQSLVDMYIHQDIVCDPDVGYSSFYLDVDMSSTGNKKLTFEAPWDFDSAFGITTRMADPESGTFAANHKGQNRQPYYPNPWFTVVVRQNWFMEMVKDKWAEMEYFNVFQKSLDMVYNIGMKYETDFANLKTRWPQKFNSNSERTAQANARTTQKQAAQDLLNWTTKRYLYLDKIYGSSRLTLNPQVLEPNLPVIPSGGGGGGGQSQIQYNENDNDVTGNKQRFEVENGTVSGTINADKSGNGSSGGKYVGNFGSGATITMNISSPSATNGYFYLGLAAVNYASISSWFTITVNGTAIQPTADKYVPSAKTNDSWHEWFSMPVGKAALKSGSNTVVITCNQDNCTNLDYMEIKAPVTLTMA